MICPLSADKYGVRPQCYSSCVFYDSGCLIAKALKTYIKINSPIMTYNDKSLGRNPNEMDKINVGAVTQVQAYK